MRMTREQAIDFQQNENWRLLCAEIQVMINVEKDRLLACSFEDFARIQEKVKALVFCMNLPQIIADREE
jgi:hypothetical protein